MATKPEKLPVRRTVQNLLQENKASLQAALPKHITADRMIRVVLTALTTQPLLEKCTVPSILKAVIECSQLGLEPDGVLGYAYFIPFRNAAGQYEAKMIPGYRGYLDLARRSGQLKALDVDVIYEKDEFQYQKGTSPSLLFRKPLTGERGKPIGVFACARLKDGSEQFEVLTLQEIAQIQSFSKAADKGPWHTHWEAMAKKTAIRQLAKYLPLSPEFQRLAIREEYVDQGIDVPDLTADADLSALMTAATTARIDELKQTYRKPKDSDEPAAGAPDFSQTKEDDLPDFSPAAATDGEEPDAGEVV